MKQLRYIVEEAATTWVQFRQDYVKAFCDMLVPQFPETGDVFFYFLCL